jgi:hypothetical protein
MAVVNLPAELTACSICNNRFGHDLESNSNHTSTTSTQHIMLNPRIPVQSQNCEHYFCFGCIQNHHTDNTTPWIKCPVCDKGSAFQPDSPIVYRALTVLASLDSDIEQDYDASARYGEVTAVQKAFVIDEAGVEVENWEITVVQEDGGVNEDADVEADNATGNADMDMRVNTAPSNSIASSSVAHNASESIASGSKRNVENISGGRGDVHNEFKIVDMTPPQDSFAKIPAIMGMGGGNSAPMAFIPSSSIAHNVSGSENFAGNTGMKMSVNATPIVSIATTVPNVSGAKASGLNNATGNTDMKMSVNVTPIVSIATTGPNVSEAKAYGTKRKVEDISTARGDECNEHEIDISPSEDSLTQVPNVVTPTRRQGKPRQRRTFAKGTKLLKKFPIQYEGKVVKLPTEKNDKYYRVKYDDGDVEDYELNELALLAKISGQKYTRKKYKIGMGTKIIKIFNMAFEGEVVQVLLRGSKKYSLGGSQKYRVHFLANEKVELMTASTLRPLVEAYANYVLVDDVRSKNADLESQDVEDEEINGQVHQNDVGRSADANPEVENQGQHAISEGSMPPVAPKMEQMEIFKFDIETQRKYGDRVLLDRQADIGMMKLGGENCGMDLFPKFSEENENHPRFRDLGDTKAIAYEDLWQPDGPKYACQDCAHVACVPDMQNAFSVFMNRTLKNGRDSLGWEYCGEYICTDPESDIVTWTSAHTLTRSQRNKMITDIVSSCKNCNGDWKQDMMGWRKGLAATLLTDPTPATAAPLWMIKDRLPTSAELEDVSPVSLAARARAFGFRPGISTKKLAEIVVRLDEFHLSKPIKFVSYDESVYNYVCAGETTRNPRGKQKRDGEPCAKASDWYAHLDQQIR